MSPRVGHAEFSGSLRKVLMKSTVWELIMARRITPGGGPKPDKLMRDALALELHQEVKLKTGEKIKKLRLVARALVDNAIGGNTAAVRECFDRMDGKVTQSAEATQVLGNVTFTWQSPED
jgi:hypothetical protein